MLMPIENRYNHFCGFEIKSNHWLSVSGKFLLLNKVGPLLTQYHHVTETNGQTNKSDKLTE